MKCVSIGYFRDDGDFALLATLNNNDGDIRLDRKSTRLNSSH